MNVYGQVENFIIHIFILYSFKKYLYIDKLSQTSFRAHKKMKTQKIPSRTFKQSTYTLQRRTLIPYYNAYIVLRFHFEKFPPCIWNSSAATNWTTLSAAQPQFEVCQLFASFHTAHPPPQQRLFRKHPHENTPEISTHWRLTDGLQIAIRLMPFYYVTTRLKSSFFILTMINGDLLRLFFSFLLLFLFSWDYFRREMRDGAWPISIWSNYFVVCAVLIFVWRLIGILSEWAFVWTFTFSNSSIVKKLLWHYYLRLLFNVKFKYSSIHFCFVEIYS